MMLLSRWARRIGLGRAVSLGLLLALMALRAADPPVVQALRAQTFDAFQQIRPNESPARPAVIVDIDERSLAAYGQWPWPRTVVADLVDKLVKMGSAAIGFDIIFAEPDRMSPAVAAGSFRNIDEETKARLEKLPSNDDVLAQTLRRGRVVLGESGHHLQTTSPKDVPPPTGFAMLGADPRPFLIDFPGLVVNIPVLEQAAAGRGMLTIQPEADGIVRRVPEVMAAQGQLYPSLTLEMLRVVTGAGAVRIKTGVAGIESVALPGLVLPTDRHGQLWVHFGRYDPQRYVSASDVLEGRVPADRIARRLVLIGTSAVGLRDIKTTPIDPAMSGVEVHAQVLENILSHSMLTYPTYAVGAELAVLAVVGVFVIVLGPMMGAATMLGLGAVVAAALAGGAWYLFVQQRLLLDVSYVLLSTFAIYVTLMFFNYFREQLQRRRIRTAFGQYLAPSLVEQLAHSHETLVLGGEERDMTVMFSDIRGFTTISESFKHDPTGLTSLINHFLTPMTAAIVEHQGTIDKYIGDAIMAFWNAPLHDKAHQRNACAAALEMLARVAALNETRQREAADGGHVFIPIDIGIGVNTGRCVVGNLGSDMRFNYSVLGDAVNVASRLEGQSKTYGVPIVIGAATAAAARDDFAILELDRITVKGKREPETISTVLGDKSVADSEKFKALAAAFTEMQAHYRRADFDAALRALAGCRTAAASFRLAGLCDLYAMRIAAFLEAPPPEGWNGVFNMTEK